MLDLLEHDFKDNGVKILVINILHNYNHILKFNFNLNRDLMVN